MHLNKIVDICSAIFCLYFIVLYNTTGMSHPIKQTALITVLHIIITLWSANYLSGTIGLRFVPQVLISVNILSFMCVTRGEQTLITVTILGIMLKSPYMSFIPLFLFVLWLNILVSCFYTFRHQASCCCNATWNVYVKLLFVLRAGVCRDVYGFMF